MSNRRKRESDSKFYQLRICPPDDLLQKWPVSQRVNSSKAPTDDPSLSMRPMIVPPRRNSAWTPSQKGRIVPIITGRAQ